MIDDRRGCRSLATCLLAITVSWLAGCETPVPPPTPRAPPQTADQQFEAASKRYLTDMLALTPVAATSLGDHHHDGELDDVSPEGYARRVALARSLITQLQGIDATKLSRPNQVDIRLLSTELQGEIWRTEQLQEWRWNPLVYTGLAGDSLYLLMARDYEPLPDRMHAAGKRLTELSRMLKQARESLAPARVPKIHAETAIKQNPGVVTIIDQMIVPQLGTLPPADQESLKTAIAGARAALMQHQIWLEKKLLPDAKGDFRLGKRLYESQLRYTLRSSLTAADIRSRAEVELTRTRQDMYDIARTVLAKPHTPTLPANPTQDEQQRGIAEALELAYQQQPQRAEVFDTARQAVEEARSFIKSHDLVTVYEDPLEIIAMPAYQRGVALAYTDSPGPLDKGQKTFFAVAPIPEDWGQREVKSYLREYNTRSIYDLTLHEAMPGHYLQLTHANRYGSSPLRAVLASGTFIEGWAVYGERMMVEQGFRGNDPLMRLIQLKWYLRTIANAILDVGVHAGNLSHTEAMELLTYDTFQEDREAEAKWARVQLTAAQLPAYFVGLQEHVALREEAKQRWGKDFTLKRYHDAVLAYGSPPIRYVRQLIFELPID